MSNRDSFHSTLVITSLPSVVLAVVILTPAFRAMVCIPLLPGADRSIWNSSPTFIVANGYFRLNLTFAVELLSIALTVR